MTKFLITKKGDKDYKLVLNSISNKSLKEIKKDIEKGFKIKQIE